jgi:prefoldin subunit 5
MEKNTMVSVERIEQQKQEWQTLSGQLQQQVVSLQKEIDKIYDQLSQLSGAIQACEVLVGLSESQPASLNS